jgi:S-adenosylmethionine/arginine decarboxylase-like enzyme
LMEIQVNEKDNRLSCVALVEGGNLTMQILPFSKYVTVNYFTRVESVKPYEAFVSLQKSFEAKNVNENEIQVG